MTGGIHNAAASFFTHQGLSPKRLDEVIQRLLHGGLNALSDIQLLAIPEAVVTLSKALLKESALPAKALDDSLHIAIAAVHGVDYLLTWNCRHIDNAETKPVMRKVCAAHGYACAEICTPQELMGVNKDGR